MTQLKDAKGFLAIFPEHITWIVTSTTIAVC